MNIEDYTAYPSGILIHNSFKSRIEKCYPEDVKEELWENFKLLVKIANEENNLGENK